MFRKLAIVVGGLLLTACGSKTVYVISTEPETTVKETTTSSSTTTDAPIAIAPSYTTEDEFIFDIENSYGPIYADEQTVIGVGYATCTFLRGGGTADDLYTSMEGAALNSGGDINFIIAVVASAITNFCPDQAWKI